MRKDTEIPTILILLGATGDLMGRKIVPALFDLHRKGKLPHPTYIIGFSRREFNNETFRKYVLSLIKSEQDDDLRSFLNHFYYQQGDFNNRQGYIDLTHTINAINHHSRVCSHKLFYLAVPPIYYKHILGELKQTGLAQACSPQEGWTRIVVEKPFGKNAQSAQELDTLLGSLFEEDQIYRIDHYLGKEMLQNIISFRFANNILEDSWNNTMIEKIEIKLWETLGVERRAQFYEGVGALRDVGQNHLMQMLALITMEQPEKLSADAIRQQRARILSQVITPDTSGRNSYRAQYEGYKDAEGVAPDSQTETYFKIRLEIDSPRWKNVPVYLESGKNMKRAEKEIVVTFKHPQPCFCPPGSKHEPNKVIFQLEPKEKIIIQFLAKKPGFTYAVHPQSFQFSLHKRHYRNQYAGEYERLLLDAIMGEQTLFVSSKEVSEMWRVIDPIVESWSKGKVPLDVYQPHTGELAVNNVR